MVNQHPQPVDDCPCFEDAIAFVSVIMGSLLAQWHGAQYGFDAAFFIKHMPGGDGNDWTALSTWWLFATVKMVIGAYSCVSLRGPFRLTCSIRCIGDLYMAHPR